MKRRNKKDNQIYSCFTVYRLTASFSHDSMEICRLRSILKNPNHKRAPTQIKAKCAEEGLGEVMSHTHPSARLHYSQRQSFQWRQDRAAPGHPCIRCCLWLLQLSSQLCCWQWKIICVLCSVSMYHEYIPLLSHRLTKDTWMTLCPLHCQHTIWQGWQTQCPENVIWHRQKDIWY